MNLKRILGLALVFCSIAAFAVPVSGLAADDTKDLSVYFRPAVRFGTDNRTIFIIDALAPIYRGTDDIVFINTKFSPDNHEAWEINAGVGYRKMLSDKLVLGGNLFYDHRKTKYDSHFDQIGLGFEAMAEVNNIGLSTRFNYYQPLTRAKLGVGSGYVFYGSGIYTAGIEEAMTGFDYDAGIRIPGISNYVETWAYAGGYHFFGCHTPDVNGFSARLEAMPTDFLRLNFEFRNDTVNHDQYYGEVAFEVPFSIDNLVAGKNPFEGIGDVLTGSRTLKERMVEPVRRDVDIVVGKDYLSGPEAAGDGNLVAGVIYVADNADSGGDGSFEHPYDDLALAAGDGRLGSTISLVHVLAGDRSGTGGATFNQDGITIWGAGANNPAYSNVVNYVQGWPLVYETLTMDAQNQTVLGLYLNTYGNAIEIGSGAAGAGLSIYKNIIDAHVGIGIDYYSSGDLGAPGSPVLIYDNTIASLPGEGYGYAGIYLSSGGTVYAQILDNRIGPVLGNSGAYGIYLDAGGDFEGEISGNTISDVETRGYAYGIRAYAGNDFNGSILGNTVSGVEAYNYMGVEATGIYAASGDDFTGSISGNTVNDIWAEYAMGAYAAGIRVDAGYDFLGSVSGNTVSDIVADDASYVEAAGIDVYSGNDMAGFINGNKISNVSTYYGSNYSGAFGINVDTDNAVLGSISNNTITGIHAEYAEYVCAAGIFLGDYYNDEGVGYFGGSISGNAVSGLTATYANEANAYGIFAYVNGGDLNGSITNNTIEGLEAYDAEYTYAYGIFAQADSEYYGSDPIGGSVGCAFTGNTITSVLSHDGDSSYAYGISGIADGAYTGSISGNTVSGVNAYDTDYGSACGIQGEGEDLFSGAISGNTLSDISGDDYAYGMLLGARYDFTSSIYGNTISGIAAGDGWADGICVYNGGEGSFLGSISGNTITGVTIENTYENVIGICVDDFASYAGAIADNTLTGISSPAYAVGIYLGDWYTTSNGSFTTSITGNTLGLSAGVAAYGIDVETYGGILGTLSSPMVITENSGTIDAPEAYMLYLSAFNPHASSVFIGHASGGMGENHFITTGAWGGNYPNAGGPIWASDNGSFINR